MMCHRAFCSIVVLLLSVTAATRSQESIPDSIRSFEIPDSVLVVGSILLTGNTQTKDFVILREMSTRPGMLLTRQLLEYDKNRIYSLGLFNEVGINVMPSGDSTATLLVVVHERWYIFPYPIFGLIDRDWSKLFYGFGIVHNNFLGRNEKVFTSFIFGFNPSMRLTYRNPFLTEDGSNFMSAGITYSKVRNRSILAQGASDNFDERHYSGTATFGKRFGIAHTAWISATYELLEISDYQPGRTISSDGRDRYPIAGIGYAFDSRDLAEYPGSGSLVRLAVTKYGVPGDEHDYVRYEADLRQYVQLTPRITLQGRMFTGIVAGGIIPPYDHTYFGYGERIRGHFKEVHEGEFIFGMSCEAHYILVSPRYFKVGFLPEEFGLWRFALSAAVFGDAGSVWFRGNSLAQDQLIKGYGVGLHVLLPYSAVLRLEYALNEIRRGEFILDLGAAF